MADRSMQESFILEGRWGLPSWEKSKWLRGHIEYSPKQGIRLIVQGSLEPGIDPAKTMELRANAWVSYDTIHGDTDDQGKVTLFQNSGFPCRI
jgi:hypothetical protein